MIHFESSQSAGKEAIGLSIKLRVLEALEAAKGESVSGESLARTLLVSRAAVWKAINELRRDGYRISAVTNRGYCLSNESDLLSAEGIRPLLPKEYPGGLLSFHAVVDSTNQEAKRLAAAGAPHGTCVVANRQTAGKGRRGRSFCSPPDSGIYLSMVLRPALTSAEAVLVTAAAAVEVSRAILEVCGVEVGIKWINDLFLRGKKVGGILTEAVSDLETGLVEFIVLGVGINVYQNPGEFPLELGEVVGALSDGKTRFSRNALAAALVSRLYRIDSLLSSLSFLDEYRSRSIVLGRPVVLRDSGEEALAESIDDQARLHLRMKDGSERVLWNGEISIRLL